MIERRDFLRMTGAAGMGCVLASPAGGVFARFNSLFPAGAPAMKEVDRKWYKTYDVDHTQCFICPLNCKLAAGETCFCRTRTNHGGRLMNHAYENPCSISIDAVEKLPLNHFLPGEQTLSLAVGGCNLRCQYCQNWEMSQNKPEKLKTFDLPVKEVADKAKGKDCRIIAYTYTEPVAFYDYLMDIAPLAREKQVRNVAATALFINPDPLKAMCEVVDAFAVALKGFDEKFYDKILGSQLAPVLKAIEVIHEQKKWMEIVTLIIPTYNDDMKKIREMCQWIRKTVGTKVPIHFGRFVPQYKLKDLPRTSQQTLEECRKIAMEEGLEYVYIFNVSPHEGNNTFCPKCRKQIVKRLGFKVLENLVADGKCSFCKEPIPGIWK